jgi:enamine deaminase RidA (YjgF/YER057c/UK114 family)
MTTPEERLAELGVTLPQPPAPVASYVPVVRSGDLLFVSGQIAMVDGELKRKGLVGREISIEDANADARVCALNALAHVKSFTGDLSRVRRIVKLTVFVASSENFHAQPSVANGASDLLAEVFGDAGRHARSAIGVAELPLGAAVEVEMIAEVSEAPPSSPD